MNLFLITSAHTSTWKHSWNDLETVRCGFSGPQIWSLCTFENLCRVKWFSSVNKMKQFKLWWWMIQSENILHLLKSSGNKCWTFIKLYGYRDLWVKSLYTNKDITPIWILISWHLCVDFFVFYPWCFPPAQHIPPYLGKLLLFLLF